MKVLVTGGSGFVGSRVIPALIAAGHGVRNIDIAPSKLHGEFTEIGDICSRAACDAAVKGVDAIIHLAALYRDDVRPRERYYEVNVEGTQRLIEAATEHGIKHIIFASSFSVYGLDAAERLEDGGVDPVNDYGRSKLQAERLLTSWAHGDASRVLRIVRPCVIFGEGNRGNVYNLVAQIASGRFAMIGAGRNKKSMAYVDNIAQFLVYLLERVSPGVTVLNYADKPDLCVADIVQTIADALDRRVLRLPLPRAVAHLVGALADACSSLSGRQLPITAERVAKFLADTSLPTEKLEATGFVRPVEWRQALVRTVKYEFGPTHDGPGAGDT